jgi:hypothetical protein
MEQLDFFIFLNKEGPKMQRICGTGLEIIKKQHWNKYIVLIPRNLNKDSRRNHNGCNKEG